MDLRSILIEYTDSIRNYEHESGHSIWADERESHEFVEIFLEKRAQRLREEEVKPETEGLPLHVVSVSVCSCNKLPDGEIAISSKALTDPNWTDRQTDR